MLVLSRRVGQKIQIGQSIVVTLLCVDRNKARLGVEAPRDVRVFRQELLEFARERPIVSVGRPNVSGCEPTRRSTARGHGFSSARALWEGMSAYDRGRDASY